MKSYNKIIIGVVIIILLVLGVDSLVGRKAVVPTVEKNASPVQNAANTVTSNSAINPAQATVTPASEIKYVGPRGNVPDGAPKDYGFWSFAIPVPGVLSRSGQPTVTDFKWLKANGWKSDIDLRIDGDHNEVSDDANIPGFNALGFNYLKIQMVDGAAPTDDQANQFLSFVTKPQNQPAEVHCRGGIGRAGIMVALYRYSVQDWPIDKILEESKLYQGGIDAGQQKFLAQWAASHPAGSYGK